MLSASSSTAVQKEQVMDNQEEPKGAGMLRHMGPAAKKAKKKKTMPPSKPNMPMSQGMSGMNQPDDESNY